MAFEILEARDFPKERVYKVLLDDTQVDSNGNPQPGYVREFRWGNDVSLPAARREMKRICAVELARMRNSEPDAGNVLADEGRTL